jgi:hypothetical protein
VQASGEPGRSNSHVCSMKSLTPTVFPSETGMFQRNVINNVPEDMIITQQCSNLNDELLMNT